MEQKKRTLICKHPCANDCKFGVPVAMFEDKIYCCILNDTTFENKLCPFFKRGERVNYTDDGEEEDDFDTD